MPFDINGIGGVVQPTEGVEPINPILGNTTLMAGEFSANSPIKPEIIKGLATFEQFSDHFAPTVELEMETEEGTMQKETIGFKKMSDFGISGISKQSHILNELTTKKEQYETITRQLKTNKRLRQALADETTRQAFIQALQALIEELDESA